MDMGLVLKQLYTDASDADKVLIEDYLKSKLNTDKSYENLYLSLLDVLSN